MGNYNNQEPGFDWYTVVSNTSPLEQGDLLNNFPIIVIPPSIADIPDKPIGEQIEAKEPYKVKTYNVIVMTQSCDFAKLKDEDEIILCPLFNYSELFSKEPKKWGPDQWKNLINGRIIHIYIVNKYDAQDHKFDYQVVDLRRIFSVPLSLVKKVATNQNSRVRLLPPYREHLAQAFARQFMRVGLPIDLPREFPYKKN